MLTSLKITNFKRFRELKIGNLKRVNLIAGKNNTGKTGVLEALLLLLDGARHAQNLPKTFRNCGALGDANKTFWPWQFHQQNTSTPIRFEGQTDKLSFFGNVISLGNPPAGAVFIQPIAPGVMFASLPSVPSVPSSHKGGFHLPTVPLSVYPTDPQKDAIDYDRVVLKARGEERLERLLQKLEPRLQSIRSIKPHGASLIYVDVGLAEKIPAIHLGQGFLRLLSIYSELIASNERVLLIDEVENGLHHSALVDVWRGLLNAAEQEDVQIFATTHSYECLQAAHEAFAETLDYDFAVHRLEEVRGEIVAVSYDRQTLETSLLSNFEVR